VKDTAAAMDLSCNETMINDIENQYTSDYSSDGKSATSTSAGSSSSSGLPKKPLAKLYSNACEDQTFLKDRCLKNLLTSQKRYTTPSCDYFNTIQKPLTPQMRKIVAEWVIEVSSNIALVFPRAIIRRREYETFSLFGDVEEEKLKRTAASIVCRVREISVEIYIFERQKNEKTPE
jgi:hypothetical protein